MKVKALLTFTAIVSSILGALVVYLVLSVPNDLRADSLMKQAKKDLDEGKTASARTSYAKVVQQYPRTDAAAAATVALISLGDREREDVNRALTVLRKQNEEQARLIANLQQNVTTIRNTPPPTPVIVQAPAPKPAAKKVTPKKKPAAKKKSTRRRR